MRTFGLKVCLFLFLVAAFARRTNVLGAVIGAITGTILLWPIYKRIAAPPLENKKPKTEEDSAPISRD